MRQDHATEEDLFALLDRIGVAHETVRHRPVFTVAEGLDLKAQIPGVHSKNLFLKDKTGALTLLSAAADTQIDLTAFAKATGAKRYSFGSAELLLQTLGVTPGSVTAFAAINDPDQRVMVALDAALLNGDFVNFHPLRNDATTRVTPKGLLAFFTAIGRRPRIFAFDKNGLPIDATRSTDHVTEA